MADANPTLARLLFQDQAARAYERRGCIGFAAVNSFAETLGDEALYELRQSVDDLIFNHGCLDAPDLLPAGSVYSRGRSWFAPASTQYPRFGVSEKVSTSLRLLHDAARVVGTSDRHQASAKTPIARCSVDDSGLTCSGLVRFIDGREGWRNRFCEKHWPMAYLDGWATV